MYACEKFWNVSATTSWIKRKNLDTMIIAFDSLVFRLDSCEQENDYVYI